jgi:hypothetical protein
MRDKYLVYIHIFIISACILGLYNLSFAQTKAPAEPLTIGAEGGKLPPVTFSHKIHTEKSKINCAVCHHKDDNPKEPQGCFKCHPIKVTGDNAPAAKMAFHKMCIICHRENLTKGIKAPVQCIECHRK